MTRIHVHGWKHLPESKGVVKDRDGGDDRDVRRLTKSFLAAGGVNWLGRQGLIHGDIRHYGGSAYLRQKFKTRQIVTGPARFRSTGYRGLPSASNSRRRSTRMSSFVISANAGMVHSVGFMNRPTPSFAASEPATGWR